MSEEGLEKKQRGFGKDSVISTEEYLKKKEQEFEKEEVI